MTEMVVVRKNDGSLLCCTASELASRVINSNLKLSEIERIEDMAGYDITKIVRCIIAWEECHSISEQMKYTQACNLIVYLRDQLNERSSNDQLQTQEALISRHTGIQS